MTRPLRSQAAYRQGWRSAVAGEPHQSCGIEGCATCAAWNEGHAAALAERLKDPPATTGEQR